MQQNVPVSRFHMPEKQTSRRYIPASAALTPRVALTPGLQPLCRTSRRASVPVQGEQRP